MTASLPLSRIFSASEGGRTKGSVLLIFRRGRGNEKKVGGLRFYRNLKKLTPLSFSSFSFSPFFPLSLSLNGGKSTRPRRPQQKPFPPLQTLSLSHTRRKKETSAYSHFMKSVFCLVFLL